MKILVVGGNGSLGGHSATHLAQKGYDVSVASRRRPQDGTPMAGLPFLQGDYVNGDFSPARLEGFDSIVFAAQNDMRHLPPSEDLNRHLLKANVEGIPKFVRSARQAGVRRVVHLGSFYTQAKPELEKTDFYIHTRRLTCEGVRAETGPGFDVVAVNPPFMIGAVPGLDSPLINAIVEWAEGNTDVPLFAPLGGTNFMSYRSLSQAIEGALLRGEPGKAYLVGDENLSIADLSNLFFKAAGNPKVVEARAEQHPIFSELVLPQGPNNWIRYEPDPAETALLGYMRNDVSNGVADALAQYEATH
ncbi:NAD-dependent epimerase/dehydratase family protein [Aquisediminimonas profunda]|uniref:NAD-dependent epimerase/dehydratase family protein n=1 Tax=Aquisediminimonas profunda TaxID=1550733 RepID=UPI001C629D05|nr:NAD-dependent epimerase/dehydratase family protein [Aquisediminimonas profunda]